MQLYGTWVCRVIVYRTSSRWDFLSADLGAPSLPLRATELISYRRRCRLIFENAAFEKLPTACMGAPERASEFGSSNLLETD